MFVSCNDSQPVSLDNMSMETSLVVPVTILATSFCILSIAFISYCVQLSNTISAYSRAGCINEIYILFKESLSSKYLNLRMTCKFCHTLAFI